MGFYDWIGCSRNSLLFESHNLRDDKYSIIPSVTTKMCLIAPYKTIPQQFNVI